MPPSPCIGSIMTAHVSFFIAAAVESMSLKWANFTCGINGSKGSLYFEFEVADSDPNVLP